MAYEMVMPYHLHMPSYFLETFTEYPCLKKEWLATCNAITNHEAPSFNLSYCFLIYSMALANCAELMEKAKRDWYYEYNGIKAEIS